MKLRLIVISVVFVIGALLVSRKVPLVYSAQSTPTPVPTSTASAPATPGGPIHPDIPCATPNATDDSASKVDILFVLDTTGSMSGSIEGVKNSIRAFVDEFRQRDIDPRVGLIAFRDNFIHEDPQLLTFNDDALFTSDPGCFSNAVSKLVAFDGGDTPESALDAMVLAAKQTFRQNVSRKVLIVITDAPPHVPDSNTQTIDDAVSAIRKAKFTFLYFIVNDKDIYSQIRQKAGIGGGVLSLQDAVSGKLGFDQLLPEIARKVAE